MLWCRGCQQAIDEWTLETKYEYYEDVHASRPYDVCPHCGCDVLSDAAECEICSNYHDGGDSSVHICTECEDELNKQISGIVKWILDKSAYPMDIEDAEAILYERVVQKFDR